MARLMLVAAAVAVVVVVAASGAAAQPTPPLPQFTEALKALYMNTHGDHWTNNDGWLKSDDYCTWHGINCPIHNHTIITDIMLSNNNLTGTIPAIFPEIFTLKTLDLSHNSIEGQLPANFAEIVPLQIINLQFNQITGTLPANIANVSTNWPSLKEINLFNNKLTGTIPESLFGPATLPVFHPRFNLQVFDVHNNMLTGPIPSRASRAALMTTFLLNDNDMSGTIPAEIDTWLLGLKYCSLDGNKWACPVPEDVSDKCQAYCS
uniref:Leucine-rich repeat-containing N-terminal plant-type domain-containing protein n=1 Tax=Bicosoecida sp. CB-2014 TaxID=1486930 RepID=A0A7S1CLY0_9STRA|mmetsp:Transcript_3784/g.14020  ORF Transcript_3784/g.14020 Transcript_3784/m.14020 type:complete len:263 (+) Transcript_3784:97-885(+)